MGPRLRSTPTLHALEGAQLPFGAHKGAMIAMMVELLAAALAGGALATDAAEASKAAQKQARTRRRPTLASVGL